MLHRSKPTQEQLGKGPTLENPYEVFWDTTSRLVVIAPYHHCARNEKRHHLFHIAVVYFFARGWLSRLHSVMLQLDLPEPWPARAQDTSRPVHVFITLILSAFLPKVLMPLFPSETKMAVQGQSVILAFLRESYIPAC